MIGEHEYMQIEKAIKRADEFCNSDLVQKIRRDHQEVKVPYYVFNSCDSNNKTYTEHIR